MSFYHEHFLCVHNLACFVNKVLCLSIVFSIISQQILIIVRIQGPFKLTSEKLDLKETRTKPESIDVLLQRAESGRKRK